MHPHPVVHNSLLHLGSLNMIVSRLLGHSAPTILALHQGIYLHPILQMDSAPLRPLQAVAGREDHLMTRLSPWSRITPAKLSEQTRHHRISDQGHNPPHQAPDTLVSSRRLSRTTSSRTCTLLPLLLPTVIRKPHRRLHVDRINQRPCLLFRVFHVLRSLLHAAQAHKRHQPNHQPSRQHLSSNRPLQPGDTPSLIQALSILRPLLRTPT